VRVACETGRRHVSDTVTVHESIAVKAKTPDEKRPFMEEKVGDGYSYARGR
jgi:hypothetical protein